MRTSGGGIVHVGVIGRQPAPGGAHVARGGMHLGRRGTHAGDRAHPQVRRHPGVHAHAMPPTPKLLPTPYLDFVQIKVEVQKSGNRPNDGCRGQ